MGMHRGIMGGKSAEVVKAMQWQSQQAEKAAATTIQAAHRSSMARKTVAGMREKRQHLREQQLQHSAAATIQAVHRRSMARKTVAGMREEQRSKECAATTIQAA